MVLGFILYETVDIIYNLTAMTYNGTAYAYRWYCGMEDETVKKEKEIEELRVRLSDLENQLLTNGTSKDHKTAEKWKKKD